MPLYEYECPACGMFEYSQRMEDEPLTQCPTCASVIQRIVGAANFSLRGDGWYRDGYSSSASTSSSSSARTTKTK